MEELTFGQKLVGIRFNHAEDAEDDVHNAKQAFADVVDMIGDPSLDKERKSWMTNVLRTAAINGIVLAQMSVVKYLTWKE